jgi:ribosomal protein S4
VIAAEIQKQQTTVRDQRRKLRSAAAFDGSESRQRFARALRELRRVVRVRVGLPFESILESLGIP